MVEVFRPGNIAPHSGVYRATHAQQHAEPHYVTLLFGETFPPLPDMLQTGAVRTCDFCCSRERTPAFSACGLKIRQKLGVPITSSGMTTACIDCVLDIGSAEAQMLHLCRTSNSVWAILSVCFSFCSASTPAKYVHEIALHVR